MRISGNLGQPGSNWFCFQTDLNLTLVNDLRLSIATQRIWSTTPSIHPLRSKIICKLKVTLWIRNLFESECGVFRRDIFTSITSSASVKFHFINVIWNSSCMYHFGNIQFCKVLSEPASTKLRFYYNFRIRNTKLSYNIAIDTVFFENTSRF